jgi:hypothetical protein
MSKDNATTNFPKMGDDGIVKSVVNISGQRSPYTKATGKKGFGKSGAIPGTGDKANKGASSMSGENPGPRCYIQEKIAYPNSPESAKVLRNTKRVQGPYSFELARSQAGNTKNV